MSIVELIFRWVHIFAAVGLGGGLFFLCFVYYPALKTLSEESWQAFDTAMRARWSKLVGIFSLLLIGSGLYNAFITIKQFSLPGYYNILLMAKIVLALVVVFLASLLAGKTTLAEKIRLKASLWSGVTVLLVVMLIALAGVMKLSEHKKKEKKSPESSQTAQLNPAHG